MNAPRAPVRGPLLGRWLCLGGAALGALGLLGWITGVSFFTTLAPGQPPMMPNSALALLMLGVAGALRHQTDVGRVQRTLSLLAATVALAVGIGTLAEYALHIDLNIDRVFVASQVGPYPGRPSPPTALALAFLAVAILLFDSRPTARARPSEWLVLFAGFIAFTALLGQLFGEGRLYRLTDAPVIGVAVPTALSLLLTAVGLLLERPDAGVVRVATSAGPGGGLLRRLSLVAILAPAVLGYVAARILPGVGVEDFPLVFAILAAAMTAASLFLLTVTAAPLNRAHDVLELSLTRTRELVEQASISADAIVSIDQDQRITAFNDGAEKIFGYSREEAVGAPLDLLIPERFRSIHRQHVERFAAGLEVARRVGERGSKLLGLRKNGEEFPAEAAISKLEVGGNRILTVALRDATEQTRAQDLVREAQERLQLALDGAGLAAWDWNIKTGEVIFSPRWAEMRGLRPEEIAPHVDTWLSGLHPDDAPRAQKALTDHFQKLTAEYRIELRVRTGSGQWIWILDLGKVFERDDRGEPIRMVGVELDINERKRLEAELRLAEAKSSGIVSISADAIVSIDEGQRITMFNDGAEKIFGYSREEAVGAPLDILVPERFRGIHREHVERFAAGREVARRMGERGSKIFGLRKNGEEFPADAAISKMEAGGRRILTVALRDATEQRRMENEQKFLAQVGAVLASTLDYEETAKSVARVLIGDLADFCILETEGERGQARRLVVAHRDPGKAAVAHNLQGIQLDRRRPYLGSSVFETKQPLLMREVTPEHLESIAQSEEHRQALRDLSPRSLMAAPLLAHGRVVGSMVVIRTAGARPYEQEDLPLLEEIALRAAMAVENARLYEIARRAIQARDDVLGVVAHDLRNPLGTMVMQAALLRRRGGEPERRSRKPAEAIERAATRMDRLIQDLLDVTRMEAGRLSVEQGRVPAGPVVSDSVEAQKPLASQSSLELLLDLAPALPEVWADRDRLLQVFENLIGNAVKFTEPGGRISAGAAPRDGEVLFWVADTGPGITAEDLPHLFDRFWQARKAGRRGAGLGLPIVKGIVEAHGGRIWVESTPGRGSTFFFTVPTAPRTEQWRGEPAPAIDRHS
jgi:PAS domain S-box-containing protein